MADHSRNQSELFGEDQIPTADPDPPSKRTIHDSGWWRAHFLVLVSVVFLALIGLPLLIVMRATSVGSPLYQFSSQLLAFVVLGFILILLGSAFASFYGFYVEAKILEQSNADWQPYWWLYILATPFLSAIVVSLIYLIQRERHVGIQWDQLAIWR